jgi:hypothetical protein
MYAAFYGSFLHLSADAYVVTIAHRLTIIILLAVLVLALMRQLLPAGIAWLMAAWWVALPVDFDAVYEVHLFAIIPMIAALLVVGLKPGPWGRGWGIAILLAAAVLMRNELLLATGGIAALALGWEFSGRRRGERSVIGILKPYGVPLLFAVLLILLAFARASDRHEIREALDAKNRLNMCQAYAIGYQQRHPDWKGSPWTDCGQLMTKMYGRPEPSFVEALRANPRAMLGHFSWNVGLIPSSLQVLLFSATSGNVTFDGIPVVTKSSLALVLSALVGAILMAGGILLYRDRDRWPLKGRGWVWIGLLLLALMVILGAVVERPRPEYMFSLGLLTRAAFGACLVAIANRFPAVKQLAFALPAVILLLILLVPMHYHTPPFSAGRGLLKSYRRLEPFQELIEKPNTGLVSLRWPSELCSYLGKFGSCRGLSFGALRGEVSAGSRWDIVLARNGATLFFADEGVLADPVSRESVDNAAQDGWETIAAVNAPAQNWRLLVAPVKTDIVPAGRSVRLGKGWYDHETFRGEEFRWVNNDAELYVRRWDAAPVSLAISLEGGPSLDGQPLVLQAFADGKLISTATSTQQETIEFRLPGDDRKDNTTVRLHVSGSPGKTFKGEPRVLNFRVFDIAVSQ